MTARFHWETYARDVQAEGIDELREVLLARRPASAWQGAGTCAKIARFEAAGVYGGLGLIASGKFPQRAKKVVII
jgi:hypothetical protein